MVRSFLFVVTGLVALGLSACGDRNKFPVYPTSGQVLINDAPRENVMVVLHPTKDTAEKYKDTRPIAYTDKDGKFSFTTYTAGDGVPEGDWVVTVMLKPNDGEGDDQTTSKNTIDWKFARPDTSTLKATITKGDNKLEPFKVTGKK